VRIKEVSEATGVGIEAIRFYEREKLLPLPARSDNGYRDYGPEHVQRLSFIRHCRSLDIALADIGQLLDFMDDPTGHCEDVNQLIDAQLERVRVRLKSLKALERQLVQLRSQCAAREAGQGCAILQELVSAAYNEACVCHPPAG
jgi:Cd(II)/Pb(II)-responsive transcriptional regulator